MSRIPATTGHPSLQAFYSLAALRQRACQIAHIRAAETPAVEIITPPPRAAATAPLLLLPGSYNPPTTAHLALAHTSLQAIPRAGLALALGTTIINKEGTERATLLDRVLLLDQIARRVGQLGIFLTNRGLYVEQARAARAAFPRASQIVFVVGYDKIEQIFDPRYYQDRDAALNELFALASFLVAPRANREAADVAALLQQPGNRQFQDRVQVLPFPEDYRDVASSEIRAAFQSYPATFAASSLAALLPSEALLFALETGCYSPPQPTAGGELIDRYALRTALIERALALPEVDQAALDLKRLFDIATSATPEGLRLRLLLRQPAASQAPRELLMFQGPGQEKASRDFQFY
jgi:nicotinamide-nucleotide adenylyltransferase